MPAEPYIIISMSGGTSAKHIKVVASRNIECGKTSGDGKYMTNDLEGCGTAKNDKGLASDVKKVSRDTKNERGTWQTSEPGCGKPATKKESGAGETAVCGTSLRMKPVCGKSAKCDEGCSISQATTRKIVMVGCGTTESEKIRSTIKCRTRIGGEKVMGLRQIQDWKVAQK